MHCILAHHLLCNASSAGKSQFKADTQENKDIEMCFLYTQEYRSEYRSKTHSLINRKENIQGAKKAGEEGEGRRTRDTAAAVNKAFFL